MLHRLTFWCDCDSALRMNHSCSFMISGRMEQNIFLQLFNAVEGYRWERSARVLDPNWLIVKDCAFVPFFFFQTWWIFCWTLRELCLKKQVWERGLFSPNPLNISILARHPMPACCWHIDWRTLACLPIILCKQPTVSPCTSTFPPPLILKKNLNLEGSSQPQVESGSF